MNRYIKVFVFVFLLFKFILYAGFLNEDTPAGTHTPHDHSDLYHDHSHQEATHLPEKLLFPPASSDRIILNLPEDPETSIAVNWRTDTTISEGYVEIAVSTPGPEFTNHARQVIALRQFLKVKHSEEPEVSANYFSAQITDLKPSEKYVYRVGSEGAWSEWFQITMPDVSSKKISFIYFGDAQNDLKSIFL